MVTDLIDLIMAAQERHFSRELAGVTKVNTLLSLNCFNN